MNTKSIKKLHGKKYRAETGLFLVEGEKNVLELLASDFEIREFYCTEDFLKKHGDALMIPYTIVNETELAHFGTLQTNNAALAIAVQKKAGYDGDEIISRLEKQTNGLILVLDSISDPGNLGTIIRIADWFNIRDIVASPDTVDVYNPKTISATMGSFTRVAVHPMLLTDFLESARKKNMHIIGATLDGANSHDAIFPKTGILVMGSESHGIGKNLEKYLTKKVTIPRFGHAESLNVAVATAILLDTMRR